jgi:hypothetical protein
MSLAGRLVGRISRVRYYVCFNQLVVAAWQAVRIASPIRKFEEDAFLSKIEIHFPLRCPLLQLHAVSDRKLQVAN